MGWRGEEEEKTSLVNVVHWVAAFAARLLFSTLPAISPNTGEEVCMCVGGGGSTVIHHSVLVMS